ncbi:MAG: SMC-Scp complex subunit ScpB [Gammaproteobacteria bacterium]|nr:MAG: SMC-Scp complex subunit ScpB [Gammaproteobacteria bacterium]
MDQDQIKHIVEAALLAAGRPLSLEQLRSLFGEEQPLSRNEVRAALDALRQDYEGRGIALGEVASGFRIEVRSAMSPWLTSLWEERPPRYSRALMETLSIIAYRQPVTRGDVEEIRGVAVTTNITRTLLERGWIKVVGYRDVPGKPAMYGTTREFLDYFGLRQLEDLPPLAEIRDFDRMTAQLQLPDSGFAEADVPPGSPTPLVRAPAAGLPEEPATVTSLDEVRAAAQRTPADEAAVEDSLGATVVPLNIR